VITEWLYDLTIGGEDQSEQFYQNVFAGWKTDEKTQYKRSPAGNNKDLQKTALRRSAATKIY